MFLPSVDTGAAVNRGAAAIILGLMMPDSLAAEPRVLADWELDSITAAGVLLDVSSIAAAVGASAKANTASNTFVFDGNTLDVGVGITVGQALACCDEDADVEVASTALGSGDYVRGSSRRIEVDGRRWSRGFSLGFVLALSSDAHLALDRKEHLAMMQQLRTALADFHFELPDPVMTGAH